VAAAADTARVVVDEVRSVGTFPSVEDMRSDVRLITEPRRAGGDPDSIRRDTIVRPPAVSSWLQDRRAGWHPEVLFQLETDQVYVCAGSVLQYGTYPIAGADDVDRLRFAARWMKGEDGSLELDLLSLAPMPGDARPMRLARACRDAGGLIFDSEYAARRLEVRAFLSVGTLPMSAPIREMFEDYGWGDEGMSVPLGVDVSAGYRLRGGWQLAGVLAYRLSAGVTGDTIFSETTLDRQEVLLGGLVIRELGGGFRVGAGPVLAHTRWSWTNKRTVAFGEPTAPVSDGVIRPGGILELGLSTALRSQFFLDATARYALLAPVAPPAYGNFDPPSVSGGGLWLGVGVGWWW
jgi:hypothetical protein